MTKNIQDAKLDIKDKNKHCLYIDNQLIYLKDQILKMQANLVDFDTKIKQTVFETLSENFIFKSFYKKDEEYFLKYLFNNITKDFYVKFDNFKKEFELKLNNLKTVSEAKNTRLSIIESQYKLKEEADYFETNTNNINIEINTRIRKNELEIEDIKKNIYNLKKYNITKILKDDNADDFNSNIEDNKYSNDLKLNNDYILKLDVNLNNELNDVKRDIILTKNSIKESNTKLNNYINTNQENFINNYNILNNLINNNYEELTQIKNKAFSIEQENKTINENLKELQKNFKTNNTESNKKILHEIKNQISYNNHNNLKNINEVVEYKLINFKKETEPILKEIREKNNLICKNIYNKTNERLSESINIINNQINKEIKPHVNDYISERSLVNDILFKLKDKIDMCKDDINSFKEVINKNINNYNYNNNKLNSSDRDLNYLNNLKSELALINKKINDNKVHIDTEKDNIKKNSNDIIIIHKILIEISQTLEKYKSKTHIYKNTITNYGKDIEALKDSNSNEIFNLKKNLNIVKDYLKKINIKVKNNIINENNVINKHNAKKYLAPIFIESLNNSPKSINIIKSNSKCKNNVSHNSRQNSVEKDNHSIIILES